MKAKISTRFVSTLKTPDKPLEIYDTELKGFMLRIQPITGQKIYYLRYRNQENKQQRFRIGGGSLSVMQARCMAKQVLGEVAKGLDPQGDKKNNLNQQKIESLTFTKFLEEEYKSWIHMHAKSASKIYHCLTKNFKEFLNYKLIALTPYELEKWRTRRLEGGVKPATVNRDITSLKAMLARAVEWGFLPHHPLEKFKKLKEDKSPKIRFLSDEEEANLRAALDEREENIRKERLSGNEWRAYRNIALMPCLYSKNFADYLKPMVLISMNTGLRRGSLVSLKWSDINFKNKVFTTDGENNKSGSTYHVPLNKEAYEVFQKLKEDAGDINLDNYIFTYKGQKLNSIKTSWLRLLKKAYISNFRWHDLRHHFASKLVIKGAPLNTVRDLLGHSNITMTLRYAHLCPSERERVVSLLD